MSREVYLIGCHIINSKQLFLLTRLVDSLVENNKDFVLVSHTTIPEFIVNKSVGFIYDKENPVYRRWELPNSPHWNFYTPDWRIASKYILHGASPYYHVGTLRLLLNGLKYLQTTNYEVVHWIEYDMMPDYNRAKLNSDLVSEGNDFVFHGLGSFFSFNSHGKLKNPFINADSKSLLDMLEKNSYTAEIVIMNEIFEQEPVRIFDVLQSGGDYSQNFDEVPVHWSFFSQKENELHIFLLNRQSKEINVEFLYNDARLQKTLIPNMYYKTKIGHFSLNGFSNLEIIVDGKMFFEAKGWSDTNFYHALIKDTKTWNNV